MQNGRSQEYLNHLQADRRHQQPQMPNFQRAENQPPARRCPRCDSSNTKFCYYNNYSLSQPRYFCKACRRYWTHGGTLRNVPIGGGCRKSKRPPRSSSSSSPKSDQMARGIQPLSPAGPSQDLIRTGMVSGQSFMRTSLPVNNIQPFGNMPFYSGAALPTLAAMQPLATGVNQATAPVSFRSPFGGNMTLMHGMNLQSLIHSAPQQVQAHNRLFPSQQGLIQQRPLSSWTQTSINRGLAAPSAASSSFWGGTAASGNSANGCDQVGSLLNPNQ